MKSIFIAVILVTGICANAVDGAVLAIQQLMRLEGYKSKPYRPVKGDKLTIGYGFTDHKLIKLGYLSEPSARRILAREVKDLHKFVNKHVKVFLTNSQKAALIVFVYNIGKSAFLKSTLLRVLNKGQFHLVPSELLRWNKMKKDGKVITVKGLTNRRLKEIKLWKGASNYDTKQ